MAKNVLQPIHLIVAGDLSADFVSSPVYIQYYDNVCVQLVVTTSDGVGSFSVEVSLNHVEQQGIVSVAGDWASINLSPTPVAASANTVIVIDMNQLSASYLRVRYTRTSGSGSVEGYVSGKAV